MPEDKRPSAPSGQPEQGPSGQRRRTSQPEDQESPPLYQSEVKTSLDLLSVYLSRNNQRLTEEVFKLYQTAVLNLMTKTSISSNEKAFIADYTKVVGTATKFQPSIISPEIQRISEDPRNIIKLNELVIRPEVFDGERPRPRKWIAEYEEAITANGWSQPIAIKYFATFLKGAAKDWYFTEVRPARVGSWSDIVKLFYANYLGESDFQQLSQAIERIRQKPGESVSNFIPRFRRLLLLLTPDIPESEQVRQIRLKLRPEYDQLLAYSAVNTLDKIKECCLRIEAGLTKRIESRPRKDKFIPSKNPMPSSTNRRPPRQNFVNNITESIKTCQRCDRTNHTAAECFAKRKKDGTNIQSKPNKPSPGQKDNWRKTKVLNITKPSTSKGCNLSNEWGEASDKVITFNESPQNVNLLVSKAEDLIQVPIIVNGTELSAIVDTGAHATVMSDSLYKQHKWPLKTTNSTLVGADGRRLNILGTFVAEIKMKIGSYTKVKKHSVTVIEGLTTGLLIGIELLACFDVQINTKDKKLSFAKASLRKGIFLPNKAVIPARTQTQVGAQINHIGTVLTQPIGEIMTANSVSEVSDGEIQIVVLNVDKKPMTIEAGTQIASFEEIHAASPINHISNSLQIGTSNETVQIGSQLNQTQIEQLGCMLNKYRDAFSINGTLGNIKGFYHDIELEVNAKPFAEPLRRRALVQIEETRKQIKDLLEQGIIEESNSPWASAYVLAQKKNGSWRLCIDFRKLNSMTKKIVYPLPNIDECLDTLSGKSYFSTIDFASGFWQISLTKESKEKTAFRTEDGLYQFTKMPFGLTNAPASFQKMINGVLAGLKGVNLQVFIDDVCVATKTWSEHLVMLAKLFSVVINSNLKIKPEKCVFGASKVLFLGHEISSEGIRQDLTKLSAIKKLPRPVDPKGVRRVLGMCSYYRRFVPNFAMIAAPLTQLTRKNVPFEWKTEHQNALDNLLNQLQKNATLSNFDHRKPTMVKTDASRDGVAGILLQKDGEDWKIVSCTSRRTTPAERNYGITELEGLALVYSVSKFRPYLLGKKFEILVDHCALCALNQKLTNSARLQRWAIVLSEYNYEIKYIKGEQHLDVDCLSRAPITNSEDAYIDGCVYAIVIPHDKEEWIDDYGADEESLEIVEKAKKREGSLSIKDELVYYDNRLYVPACRRDELIETIHRGKQNIHPGIDATCNLIRLNYWWPNYRADVETAVKTCQVCAKHKTIRQAQAGRVHNFEVFQPGQRIAVDSFGPIHETLLHNKHIIVAIDMFTRFIELKPVPDIQGKTYFTFLTEYCGRYGVPREILSDNSRTFRNQDVKELCNLFGINQTYTTPYHHEGNAIVERVIQTIQERLRMILADEAHRNQWDLIVPIVQLAINTSFHKSIGNMPYELTFGVRPPFFDRFSYEKRSPQDVHLKLIHSHLRELHSQAIAIQSMSQEKSKQYLEDKRRMITYELGDKVMIRAPADRPNKLSPKYKGPYEVIEKDKEIYKIKDDQNKVFTRHVSDLKTFKFGSLLMLTMLSLLVIFVIPLNCQHSFDKVRPVVWGTSKYKVSIGIANYDINYSYQSPCKLFWKAVKDHGLDLDSKGPEQISKSIQSRLNNFQALCDTLYEQEFNQIMHKFVQESKTILPELESLPTPSALSSENKTEKVNETANQTQDEFQPEVSREEYRVEIPTLTSEYFWSKYNESIKLHPEWESIAHGKHISEEFRKLHNRSRRSVTNTILDKVIDKGIEMLSGAARDAVGFFVGNLASNLVTTVIDWFNPNSVPNRVERLEVASVALQNNFDIVVQNTKYLAENQEILIRAIQQTADRLKELAQDFPRLTWISSVLVNKIVSSGGHLQRLANEAKRGYVEVDSLAYLFDMPAFSYFEREETKFHSIRFIGTNMVRMKFSVNKRSFDTQVYKVYGFGHWNNVSESPEYLEYQGSRLLIYNQSSNCMKSIEEPVSTFVAESCEELDGEDPALSIWKTTKETDDLYKYENESIVQKFEDFCYIYCFPGKIIIDGKTYRCPLEVFRLKSSVPFKIARQRHIPSRIHQNVTSKEHSIENVHIGHFEDDSDVVNELKLFDKLQEVKRNLKNITETNYVVNKTSGFWFMFLTPVIAACVGAIVLACFMKLPSRCCKTIPTIWTSEQRPGRPPIYPYRDAASSSSRQVYEMRPIASSGSDIATETPGKIYVDLSRPAIA